MKVPPPDRDVLVTIDITVRTDEAGSRFDHTVSLNLPAYSRSTVSQMIRLGRIKLNDSVKKPGHRLQFQDHITGTIPAAHGSDACKIEPEPVALNILHEDDSLIVINKPPGLVVHPAPGHASGTLVHGLCYRFPEIESAGPPGRPGIVHRIDKDTSGILIVAKNETSRMQLVQLFQSRKIEKTYLAFVFGNPENSAGRITYRIARSKKDRKKMAVSTDPADGREADTTWQVMERFDRICLLRLDIKTGRTHQIRVHCAAVGHPLVGDDTYGYKNPHRALHLSPEAAALIKRVPRQMLHAAKITFPHPETGIETTFEAPLPGDMALFHRQLKALI